MNTPVLTLLLLMLLLGLPTLAQEGARPRIIVLTDLSNEPDDEESLVRFLVYANEFDGEGLIATTSTHLKKGPREDILRKNLDVYAQVLPNLSKHAKGYPSADELKSVTRTGQAEYGMAAVGEGKSTPGSKRIIEVVDEEDSRPVWVSIWGGANTLAQALWDVKATRDAAAVEKFVAKLRVYTISDQDDAGHWIRPTFPKLFLHRLAEQRWGERILPLGVERHQRRPALPDRRDAPVRDGGQPVARGERH